MIDYQMTACVLCTRKRRDADIGLLCMHHYTRFSTTLRDIEDEAAMLDARPSLAQRVGFGGGSLASEHVSARLDVLAFRDHRTKRWEPDPEPSYSQPQPKAHGPWCLLCDHDSCTAWRAGRRRDLHDDEHESGSAVLASALGELHNWARVVREERGVAAPPTVTVTSERDLLTRQLEWVAAQPWVDEANNDLRKLLGQLQAINRTQPTKPAGRCYLPTDTGECGGNIWRTEQHTKVWRVLTDRCTREVVPVADGPAYCDRCGQHWDGEAVARLNLALDQQRREEARPRTAEGRLMRTARELATEHGIPVSTIRTRLSRLGVRATDGHYDPEALSVGAA